MASLRELRRRLSERVVGASEWLRPRLRCHYGVADVAHVAGVPLLSLSPGRANNTDLRPAAQLIVPQKGDGTDFVAVDLPGAPGGVQLTTGPGRLL